MLQRAAPRRLLPGALPRCRGSGLPGSLRPSWRLQQPLHEALVELFKQEGFAGATVLRGVAGFGAHSIYHTDRILRLSRDMPIIVEVVETREMLESVMPRIDEMMCGGMITMEKATVIRYAHKHEHGTA